MRLSIFFILGSFLVVGCCNDVKNETLNFNNSTIEEKGVEYKKIRVPFFSGCPESCFENSENLNHFIRIKEKNNSENPLELTDVLEIIKKNELFKISYEDKLTIQKNTYSGLINSICSNIPSILVQPNLDHDIFDKCQKCLRKNNKWVYEIFGARNFWIINVERTVKEKFGNGYHPKRLPQLILIDPLNGEIYYDRCTVRKMLENEHKIRGADLFEIFRNAMEKDKARGVVFLKNELNKIDRKTLERFLEEEAVRGNKEKIDLVFETELVDNKNHIYEKILFHAISHGHTGLVKAMLDLKTDVYGSYIEMPAIEKAKRPCYSDIIDVFSESGHKIEKKECIGKIL